MRGLESPIEPAGPRSPSRRRCAPHTIAILSLAALLALCLILPDTEKLHNFSDKLINTAGSSLESVTGYAGWRKEPATYEPPSLPNSGDQNASFVPAMIFNSSLPPCDRTFLYSFEMNTGFNGQMGLLVRAAVLAEAMNYHLLLDDDNWLYGRWTDYFAPYEPTCLPADDWKDRTRRQNVTHKNEATWKQANHIFGPIGAGYLDVLTLALHVDGKFMKEQHLRDIEAYPPPTPISSRDTVPDWFAESYKAQSRWMAKLWRLSPEVSQMVEEERDALGWDLPGWDDRPRSTPADVVIGAHVRMGDKCFETNALKAGPLRFAKQLLGTESEKAMDGEQCTPDGKLTINDSHAQAYFDAAIAEVNAILAEHAGKGVPEQPDYSTETWGESKPTLLVMSDESAVLDALREHNSSAPFRLLHTANAKVKELEHGFIGGGFFHVSMADRIKSTRPMVRDMELLSRHAGGLVFMAISNVGRTLALLPGFQEIQEARLMAVDGTLPSSPIVRSADTLTARWFPTAYYN